MKKLIMLIAASALMCVTACKTTEANYKAAYETARQKKYDTGDSLTTSGLKNADLPRPMAFGSDTLMVRTEPVAQSKTEGAKVSALCKYCVVTAKFRQLFNARSMCDRLLQLGYAGAMVVHNRTQQYYVVARSTDLPSEARATVEKLRADTALSLKEPFPYVLRPAQLVR